MRLVPLVLLGALLSTSLTQQDRATTPDGQIGDPDLDAGQPSADLDPPSQHDLRLLLLSTLLVALCAYPLKLVISWLAATTTTAVTAKGSGRTRVNTNRHAGATTHLQQPHQQHDYQQYHHQQGSAPAQAKVDFPAAGRMQRRTPQTDRPFRFRAPDMDSEGHTDYGQQQDSVLPAAPQTAPTFRIRKQQQVELRTSPGSQPHRAARRPASRQAAIHEEQQQQVAGGWEPELLQQCAANQQFISSEDALQRSPLFLDHIRSVRGKQLSYERKETHKMRVYKALREVDPESFQRLFSRTDIKEYDAVPLTRWQAALECMLTAALAWACLALPFWFPAYSSHTSTGLISWLLLTAWAVSAGCTSFVAWLMNVHATFGPYANLPPMWRLAAAVLVETVFMVVPGGVLVTLVCRLRSSEHQSAGERVMLLTPLREVVRPMHFSPLAPATAAAASMAHPGSRRHSSYGAGAAGAEVQARLFDD